SITVAAVPGSNLVKISRPGGLVSLEVEPPRTPDGEVLPVQPGDLAELLTGSGEEVDTGVEVNESGDVQLADTGVTLPKETGVAIVSGKIDVSNVGAVGAQSIAPSSTPSTSSSTGGEINVIGNKVGLISTNLDASGTHGGGTVRIGGDYQGQGTIPNAEFTVVDHNSTIQADALTDSDGGGIFVWADKTTRFYGNANARGGSHSGNGGFIEISGKQDLVFDGNVDVSAVVGEDGTILFDPANITIVAGTGAQDSEVADGQILSGDGGTGNFQIAATTLGAIAGNVSLQATNDITIDNNVALNLAAGDGTGTITFTADADNAGGGSFVMNSGSSLITNGRSLTINAASATLGTLNTGSGNFNLTTNGAITQNTGTTLTIGGVATLAAGAGNDINLSGSGNNFFRVVIENARDVTLNDVGVNGIALGTSTISGNLTVTTTQGNIGNVTNDDALVVRGVATLNSGSNAINLPSPRNDFDTVRVTRSTNVTLRDTNDIKLGASTINGNLKVTANGTIIGTDRLSV
ncbi:MAG: hypothetical protein RLP02_38965, partial [Coleofasciculus sp. C2-GNP5-27]